MSSNGAMNHRSERIEVSLETLFESVDRAEEISLRAAQSCGFDEDDCQKICLAVREGVVNAIRYGNCEQREKMIRLTLVLSDDKFVVHILDQGCGFDLAGVWILSPKKISSRPPAAASS